MNKDTDERKSFWATLPGILTAIGGIIGAIAALLAAMNSAGWLKKDYGADGSKSDKSAVVAPVKRDKEPQRKDSKGGTNKLTKITFHLPDDGIPNNNGYIGPFCCTGRTATVITTDGRAVGYIYFYSWSGQAFNAGNTFYAPTAQILISGLTDLADSNSKMEKSSVEFFADNRAESRKSARAGALTFTITLEKAETLVRGGQTYFDMPSIAVSVDTTT